MSLGYSGVGPDIFLDTMSKQILQVETEISWSGTRQSHGLGPSSSCRYIPGQLTWKILVITKMMMCDVLSPIRLLIGCFLRYWLCIDDVT